MRNLSKMLAIALLALATAPLAPAGAHAQALDIDAPDIEKGESELRWVNGFNSGWRRGSAGEPRDTHKLSAAHAPTDWLRFVAHVEAANIVAESWRADHVALESFVGVRKSVEGQGLALSWYTSVQFAVEQGGTSSVLFGPVVSYTWGKTSLTANQLFEETFGDSSAPGINALFGWQLKHELSDRLALGIEWFGSIENIGDPPPWQEQDHRLGPAVFFTWDVGDKRKLGLDLGVYVGLTDAAPDLTFKVNTGVIF